MRFKTLTLGLAALFLSVFSPNIVVSALGLALAMLAVGLDIWQVITVFALLFFGKSMIERDPNWLLLVLMVFTFLVSLGITFRQENLYPVEVEDEEH